MEFKYYKKVTCGTVRICPYEHEKAFFDLTRQKTLTKKHIRALESLGFTLVEVPAPCVLSVEEE